MTDTVKLSDIKPDDKNPNKHSERGTYMLRKSMERFGFLEPGVLDKANRIVGGNSRTETAADILDADEAIVIDIDGKRPVFVRRSDIDLDTPEGREAAIALNRSAETGITWDVDVLADFAADGLELGEWWQDFELASMGIQEITNNGEWGEAMGALPDGDRAPFQQMTFTLHDSQAEQVKLALKTAAAMGDYVDSPNENSNGNALARICETFITDYGQG